MRKFKHKTTGYLATETNSEKNYKVSEPKNFTIPKWIVENSNDWEEIKKFPKIISLQHINTLKIITDKVNIEAWLEGNGTKFWQIYQVAVSENEVFALGDRVKYYGETCNLIKIYFNEHNQLSFRTNVKSVSIPKTGVFDLDVKYNKIKKAPEALFTLEQERYIIDLICKYK